MFRQPTGGHEQVLRGRLLATGGQRDDQKCRYEESGHWAEAWKTTLGTVTDSDVPTAPEIGSVPGS